MDGHVRFLIVQADSYEEAGRRAHSHIFSCGYESDPLAALNVELDVGVRLPEGRSDTGPLVKCMCSGKELVKHLNQTYFDKKVLTKRYDCLKNEIEITQKLAEKRKQEGDLCAAASHWNLMMDLAQSMSVVCYRMDYGEINTVQDIIDRGGCMEYDFDYTDGIDRTQYDDGKYTYIVSIWVYPREG